MLIAWIGSMRACCIYWSAWASSMGEWRPHRTPTE